MTCDMYPTEKKNSLIDKGKSNNSKIEIKY